MKPGLAGGQSSALKKGLAAHSPPRHSTWARENEQWSARTETRLPLSLGAEPDLSGRPADQCRAGSGPDSQSGAGGEGLAERRIAGASQRRQAAGLSPTPAVGPGPACPCPGWQSGCGRCDVTGTAQEVHPGRADLGSDPPPPTLGPGGSSPTLPPSPAGRHHP
ncbi:putative uncharacterized protein ASB16-AS1 [Moschus berezovskii]|uniref:putative uncharacterized protein ASB16-AS1 n=1 Tax=Moschus berezovskii TaxID=68408 RepID=UPI0024444A9A|nr:putative uncharacterized protein ASB16-AS1 [Moschus berezovskii]